MPTKWWYGIGSPRTQINPNPNINPIGINPNADVLTPEEEFKRSENPNPQGVNVNPTGTSPNAEGINAGRSFNLQTSALRQMLANTLEMDPDTIGNDNPIFKELVGYINPTTKKPEIIPLWEAEKIVKGKNEWLYTKNARDTFDNLGLKVLRDWGLA